ncbi:MAG TPA: hypothetical protein VGE40_11595 [Bacilli bacterium]
MNYKSQLIPTALGLYLWVLLMAYFLLLRMLEVYLFPFIYNYVIMLSIIFFAGWLDDSRGDRSIKGFKGHLLKWKKDKNISTGLLKAGTTGLLSLWAVIETGNPWVLSVVQFLLLALMTNAINLLDLRPGRALKGFLGVSTVTLLLAFSIGTLYISVKLLFPVIIGAILLYSRDVKEETMLGDAGANFLGFAAGFSIVSTTPIWFQVVILILLVTMHWIGEHHSLTKMFERNRILNWFDQLGRQ